MKRTRLMVYLLILLVGLGIIWFYGSEPSDPNRLVRVQFVGLTNDASGTQLALFKLTNNGDTRVQIEPGRHVLVRGQQTYERRFVPPAQPLAVGQSLVTEIPLPPNEPWRARFFFTVINPIRTFRDWAGRQRAFRMMGFKPWYTYTRGGGATSPWVVPSTPLTGTGVQETNSGLNIGLH